MRQARRPLAVKLLVAFIACVAVPRAMAAEQPNVVIILADDMGYGDARCFNAQSKIPTPNIDRLAAEGMRFTDAHAAGSVCVPSRYGLLTGRYPFRSRGRAGNGRVASGTVIEEGRMTLASLAREHGYATGMVGKWHLGFEGGEPYDYRRPLRGGPVDRGFDTFFGIHASTDIPPYFYIENDRVPAAPTEPIAASSTAGWSPIQGAFWRAGMIAPGMQLADVLPTFTRRAIDWLDKHHARAERQPFFLYVALTAPHTPWLPAKAFHGKSQAGLYGDFAVQVDDTLGQILAALDRHGAADDTLVVFTSDNGPVWFPEDVERFGHASTSIYRGMKGDAYEGGHRMPFVARWPGHVAAGSTSHETICLTDLMATMADILDHDLPDDACEDSFSLLPALVGRSADGARREATISLSSGGTLAIRQGDWKLIPALGSRGFSAPTTEKPPADGPTGQLYNLADDPGEQSNRWQTEPAVVARLEALLKKYQDDGRSRPRRSTLQ